MLSVKIISRGFKNTASNKTNYKKVFFIVETLKVKIKNIR